MTVPIIDGEAILRRENHEISILVATDGVTITHAWCSAGEQVAGRHLHREHTDAFYVLEGELTFEIGRGARTITVSSGGFVAAPPELAHSLRNDGDRPARWLTIHAPDGGLRRVHARPPRRRRGRVGHLGHAARRRPARTRRDRPVMIER
jgi:quercetin dioxygenase-like cupin family protein